MRADRLLQLLALLQRHRRATASWLAEQLEVSERTILRDMEALSAAGVPVYTEQGRGGGCVLLENFTTQAAGLTPTEAQALFAWAARESTAQLGLGPELAGALAKVAASAPSAAVAGAEALGGVIISDRRRWFSEADEVPWLPQLREAASSRRKLRITYQASGESESVQRTLDPIGVVDHSGRWYLVAEHHGSARTYRVSRIHSTVILDEAAEPVNTLPLQQLWEQMRSGLEQDIRPLEVVVSVALDQERDLRRLLAMQLAAGSEFEELKRDAQRVTWRLRVRQEPVITAMAVMNAPVMVLVEPSSLHERIRSAARKALITYPEAADPAP